MKILTYDSVDPVSVLDLNMTCLAHPLTPERAARIRATDPRPFPFLAVYAVIDGVLAGQVGVFRLPMMTTEGPEDVGGLWAVATSPRFRRRGIAGRLIEEAHHRMREAGLRASTLGTSRNLVAHHLYLRHGYVDAQVFRGTVASADAIERRTTLRVARAETNDLPTVDTLFDRIAAGRLGFARRHPRFLLAREAAGDLDIGNVWLIQAGDEVEGYAVAECRDSLLSVRSLLLAPGIDAAETVGALAAEMQATHIRVRVDEDQTATSLTRAGYPPVQDQAGVFMVKPLDTSLSPEGAVELLGVGSGRFLISDLDLT